CLQYSSGPFSF
nr:immunoglobulin light chain junction region [Macaca mulatta]MOW44553.1 immunoglobulin light chain junction region [Macaca mulatta]